MAPRGDDLPTPEDFAAERTPRLPEAILNPMMVPTVKAFKVSGKTGQGYDPSLGNYASTANTQHVQDTGLGPSNTDPRADQPLDPARKPSPFTEVGASGLAQYGGFVRDEFLPQLQGDRGLRVFREMYDNDPIVGSLVFAIQMLMRKVEWRVEPPEAPTVEGIVEARQQKRMQMLQEKQAAQQAQLMAGQAGLAGKVQGGPGGGGGGGGTGGASGGAGGGGSSPAPKPQPVPGIAAPNTAQAPAFHEPLPELAGNAKNPQHPFPSSDGSKGSAQGSPQPPIAPGHVGGTPDNRPGANQPNAVTRPGSNFPAAPNAPGANPGGGPNQAGALHGKDGLPGDRPRSLPSPGDPGNDTEVGGMPKRPRPNAMQKMALEMVEHSLTKLLGSGDMARDLMERSGANDVVLKAGTSGGGMAGGIQALEVGNVPMDPETQGPMEFPIGTDPLSPPSPQEQHAMELAVFVETALHDMADSWADVVSQIITMIVYGFAYHELVYKKRNGPNPDDPVQGSRFADGRIGWAKIAGRAQETRHRWEFDEFGNVLGMWQLAPPKFQLKYIPMSKALLFRTTGYKQNPEGRSVLRSAYRPWYFKRRIEEIEAIGVERDLAGLPIAYVPYQLMSPSALPAEIATLETVKQIVRNIRNDEQSSLVFPSAFDPETKQPLYRFELLSSPSRRSFDTDKIIGRYDQRIAMVALVDFILLGHESVGSKALADTKADLFTTALEAWLTVIADVFNTYAIPRLMQINGEDPAMSPRLTFGKLTRISLTEMSALITALAGAGADLFPDVGLEDALREAGGLPPKSASDTL